jgi:uncharacterized protein YndB with AHSA1/START domain
VVADLTGLRQPQATKHLQTLERAGLAVSRRSGQRRIYALQTEALQSVIAELRRVADLAEANRASREAYDEYSASVERETVAAGTDRWADNREYSFRRALTASRRTVWEHLTAPELLPLWWAPADLRLAHIEFGTTPGDRIVQEYVDADDHLGSEGIVGRATGLVEASIDGEQLSYQLSPVLPDGTTAFTAHYTYSLADTDEGTDLEVRLRISDSTIPSAEFIAGIQLGWDQSLDKLATTVAADTPNSEESS